LIALLLACAPTSPELPGQRDAAIVPGHPQITALSLDCSGEEETWSFAAKTDAWIGAATLYMTRDGIRIEAHPVPSTRAASDGTWDELRLDLTIRFDWQDAVPGTSTGWRCIDQEALSFLLVVDAQDGTTGTDCRLWGTDPEIWPDGVPACDRLLMEDTGT
jgi:hypothetical protein